MHPPDTDVARLPVQTSIGRVRITVSDLEKALNFYQGLLGLTPHQSGNNRVDLSASPNTEPLVILQERPGAVPKPRATTGLYHFAILSPNRRELARLLARLVAADWPFQGFSDHGVSEALYLADPDGNGIELYADRPRHAWPQQDGRIQMYTRPLNLRGLLAELSTEPESPDEPKLHPGTSMGHIHLHVSDLERAETFYHRLIGFDVTERNYPGALFLAAGGYHHHLGVNTWAGTNAPPPPPEAVGLLDYSILVPGPGGAAAVADRLRRAGITVRPYNSKDDAWLTNDPDGIGVVISAS